MNVAAAAPLANPEAIVRRTLAWWDHARRDLAWRAPKGERPDPYRVWLSEVLLQQTTAPAAAPYFRAFTEKWPSVEALAAAPEEAVISAFAGLGYYSRARNLHACAKDIAARGRVFPDEETALCQLPGVGAYTAAAIAAIAFDRKTTPVDGNIARILARLAALRAPAGRNRKALEALARALAPTARSGDFAQALMDLGALVCRPRAPKCEACPLTLECAAYRSGTPESFPGPKARPEKPKREGAVFFAQRLEGAFLARRRPAQGLLPSTVELPGTPWTARGLETTWADAAPVRAEWAHAGQLVQQEFTHFSLRLFVYVGRFDGDEPSGCFWVRPEDIREAGFSNIMRKAVACALSL